jgi:DNA transformation protein
MPRRDPLTLVQDLRNIGTQSAVWLREAGIYTLEDLGRVGAAEAYLRVQQRGRRVSVNLLYALQAALLNVHWADLPPEMRADLLRAVGRL